MIDRAELLRLYRVAAGPVTGREGCMVCGRFVDEHDADDTEDCARVAGLEPFLDLER